jgi:OOP family OmpA-OmpF porin
LIIGHTDSDGEIQHNYRLSLNRAQAVKDYLVTHYPIDPVRLKVIGYGESHPLVRNMSAVNKQINRRVEIGLAD